jgi:hypothetical protein
MEKLYQDYKDIAEFRIVYISEAHAIDDRRPVPYAIDKGIKEHKTYGERCSVAQRLVDEGKLTIPSVIDKMDNHVDKAYDAHPNRLFLVRKDGKLGVAGGRGPWGWEPSMEQAQKWLAQYKKTGIEPELPKKEDSN